MKRASLVLLVLFFLNQGAKPDTIEKEFKVAMGKKLELDLKTGGTIDITGWDKELVDINIRLGGRDAKDSKVDFEETSAGVRVYSHQTGHSRNHSTNLRFEIKVPKKFDIEIESNGGGISIANVEGTMKGRTMGGRLDLTKLKGYVNLKTMGGEISVTNSDLDGEVKTNGGRVLIQDVTGDLRGSSLGGQMIRKNVTNRHGDSRKDEVHISTMGGDIDVDDAPSGADVQTMGGNIRIRSASKFVKAKTMGGTIEIGQANGSVNVTTMGGNVQIDSVDGTVEATTMAGNINIKMVGDAEKGDHSAKLKSMSGDVELTVPSNLSMAVDITLAYTRESSRNYKIISDFPIQLDSTKEWDHHRGSPRKYIYGTGTIAGGKNRLRIETVNGDVYLKKGSD
jgi:DUF4097 and DUF4098 domain-containing protein YvlB